MTDRELTILAAEKVMGWTSPAENIANDCWLQQGRGRPWIRVEYDSEGARRVLESVTPREFARRFYWKSPEGEYREPIGSFSDPPGFDPLESDADALMLVDALKQRLHAAFVLGANGYAYQWTAWIIDGIWAFGHQQNEVPENGDSHILGCATASDRRRAIVLAALCAVGVEVGDEA